MFYVLHAAYGRRFFAISDEQAHVRQSLAEQAPAAPRESLPNRYEPPLSETDFRLGDHQQFRGHLLDGSHHRLR
jgi:hypothetical protein